MNNRKTLTERFLEYAVLPTNSDENSETVPSAKKELVLCELLVKQLKEAGISDVRHSGNGYIYAKLPSNSDKKIPKIGFIAHVDTSPDMSDENIKPRIIHYEGGDIVLNEKLKISTKIKDFPFLKNYVGEDLIITDGTTLLGADDKAGVAEIMDMLIRLKESGEKHGDVLVAFTPDEEIGRGADLFDVKNFGADYAYTVDGGALGEIEYENFNAASAKITVKGASIHPGSAKDKMINASEVLFKVHSMLPAWQKPEHTERYDGFFHLNSVEGTVENATAHYIIRDHDMEKFTEKKNLLEKICKYVDEFYGGGVVKCEIRDSYYNMKEKILPIYYIVENIVKAMHEEGVEPLVVPIRGGTDGARLSYMGLPCPNICTGGENFHGKYEFVSVRAMSKTSDILYRIVTDAANAGE